MQPSQRRSAERRMFLFTATLVMASMVLMGQFGRTIRKADDDQFWEFTAMFSEIYKEINEKYVDTVEPKRLFEGALQGMFLTLDPHSQYMDSDNYQQLEKDTEGSFSGIGIHINMKDGVLTVISPIPGSPAAKVGIKPRDRIVEIEGKKTDGLSLTDAVKKLTGPEGTTVKVTIYREGEPQPLQFEIVRRSIRIESVTPKLLDGGIGYIRLARFSGDAGRDMRKAIDELQSKNTLKGLILDLRFNTGGLLTEAVDVSGLFLPKDSLVVSTKGRLPNQNNFMKSDRDPVTTLPLAVLVNKATASASEIVSGAVKDHHRGVIVGIKGQRTYGKGSVQTIEELKHSFEKDDKGNPRPAAIRLTTARYYLPSGVSIDKEGVTPDIALEMPKDSDRDLLLHGMIGDPPPTDDDSQTTRSKITWKNGKITSEVEETSTSAAADLDTDEADGEATATVFIKDETTTGLKPRHTIALDKSVAGPDVEADVPQKIQPRKRRPNYVDYQLEMTRRMLIDHAEKGIDMLKWGTALKSTASANSTSGTAAQGAN